MSKASPNVIVKWDQFDKCTDHALKSWRDDRPEEALKFFVAHMRDIKDCRPQTVLNNGRTFRHAAEIPAYVSGMITLYFPSWLHDKSHRDRFLSRLACFRVHEGVFKGTKGGNETAYFKPGEEGSDKSW